ncbi:MAG: type II secretion system protein [Phycisphaeraceae bacterium]|jgi:type II secretory pathway pseudopilin PulG|nr:type II secretion system protein [Phycisphaeraceae bacterium]
MRSSTTPQRGDGFTVIELLLVISIIVLLVGLLVPAVTAFRRRATKVVCMTHLRQIGVAMELYVQENQDRFPAVRYMPDPFVSTDTDPSLIEALSAYIDLTGGEDREVYHCPGDKGYVFDLSGMSYTYVSGLSGFTVDNAPLAQWLGMTPAQIVVLRDFDNMVGADTVSGPIDIPAFHELRNLLFADGRVGNVEQ